MIVIKYLLEYLFDEAHFSLKTDNELLIKLNDFDEELLKHKSSILTLFENIACVDFIYDINSKFNTINSTLLLREGIGLMTACYSKNEYLHGEHLVEIPNKLLCLIGVDDTEDKYNEIMSESHVTKQIILTPADKTKVEVYDNKIKINILADIKDLAEMIFFNQVVAWRMEM